MKPPSHLSKEAKIEWNRVLPEIKSNALPVDQSLLESYCVTQAMVHALRKDVEANGYCYIGPNGAECSTQAATQLHKKEQLLARLRNELYFTPKARAEKLSRQVESKIKGL